MAATAVSCSLTARGCLNVGNVVSPKSAAVVNSSGSKQLVWEPLQRRHAVLRSSRASHLSASTSSAPISVVFGRKLTETSSGLRLAVPRASKREEGEEDVLRETENEEANAVQSVENPRGGVAQFFSSAAKPAVVAAMVAALLLAAPVEDSLAASSGGRMGGKAFSKPSAPSRSYSGGGGGGGGGRSYSGGGGGGVLVAPPLYGSPYGFSPFGYSPFYGGGYGGGYGYSPVGFGGGGTIILAIIAFTTVRAVVGFIRDRFSGDEEDRFDE